MARGTVERRGRSLLDAGAMSWYSRNAPFRVTRVPQPNAMGYTHQVSGCWDYIGGQFRNEADAERLCSTWNERAAIDCMVEDSP